MTTQPETLNESSLTGDNDFAKCPWETMDISDDKSKYLYYALNEESDYDDSSYNQVPYKYDSTDFGNETPLTSTDLCETLHGESFTPSNVVASIPQTQKRIEIVDHSRLDSSIKYSRDSILKILPKKVRSIVRLNLNKLRIQSASNLYNYCLSISDLNRFVDRDEVIYLSQTVHLVEGLKHAVRFLGLYDKKKLSIGFSNCLGLALSHESSYSWIKSQISAFFFSLSKNEKPCLDLFPQGWHQFMYRRINKVLRSRSTIRRLILASWFNSIPKLWEPVSYREVFSYIKSYCHVLTKDTQRKHRVIAKPDELFYIELSQGSQEIPVCTETELSEYIDTNIEQKSVSNTDQPSNDFQEALRTVCDQLIDNKKRSYVNRFEVFDSIPCNGAKDITRAEGCFRGICRKYYCKNDPLGFLPYEEVFHSFAEYKRLDGRSHVKEIRVPYFNLVQLIEDHYDEMLSNISNDCDLALIFANGKIRPITKSQGENHILSLPFQNFLFDLIQSHPTFYYTCHPIDESQFDSRFDNLTYVSGDYDQATNLFDPQWSEFIVDYICSRRKVDPIVRQMLVKHVGPVRINCSTAGPFKPIIAKNGQMMGNSLSFPLLCIVNAATYLMTYGLDKKLAESPILINGDDITFGIKDPSEYFDWVRTVEDIGLKLSAGKNFISTEFITLNSRVVVMNPPKMLPYLHMPLLINHHSSNEKPSFNKLNQPQPAHHRTEIKSFRLAGQEFNRCILGFNRNLYWKLWRMFFSHRDPRLKLFPLYFSPDRGGLGALPPPEIDIVDQYIFDSDLTQEYSRVSDRDEIYDSPNLFEMRFLARETVFKNVKRVPKDWFVMNHIFTGETVLGHQLPSKIDHLLNLSDRRRGTRFEEYLSHKYDKVVLRKVNTCYKPFLKEVPKPNDMDFIFKYLEGLQSTVSFSRACDVNVARFSLLHPFHKPEVDNSLIFMRRYDVIK